MFEEILSQAQTEHWSRRRIKEAAYEAQLTTEQRDAIWSACGHATAAEAAIAKARGVQ